jgi:hypothetical protein
MLVENLFFNTQAFNGFEKIANSLIDIAISKAFIKANNSFKSGLSTYNDLRLAILKTFGEPLPDGHYSFTTDGAEKAKAEIEKLHKETFELKFETFELSDEQYSKLLTIVTPIQMATLLDFEIFKLQE